MLRFYKFQNSNPIYGHDSFLEQKEGEEMNNKELYMILGSLKILLETNNHEKAIELIKDTMSLIDGTKKIKEDDDQNDR